MPSDYKPNENREFVVGTTLLKMASRPPYTVTWQSLTSKRRGTVVEDGCPQDTLSAYADLDDGYNLNGSYAPGYAGFVCVRRERSQLVLVHVPNMKVAVFPLPGYSKSVQQNYGEYRPSVGLWGTANHPYLSWTVGISESSNANLGSGVFDVTTGKAVSFLPKTPAGPQNSYTLVAPNGTRYRIAQGSDGNMVSKWNGSTFEQLGTVPVYGPGIGAWAANDGTIWAEETPAPKDPTAAPWTHIFIRETPGSAKTESFKVVGSNMFIGPGFAAYTPGENLYGPVRIFFPEADRTLFINNVYGQPFPAAFQQANYQIMITTSTPPVVIEVIPPS